MINTKDYYLFAGNKPQVGDIVTIINSEEVTQLFKKRRDYRDYVRSDGLLQPEHYCVPGNLNPQMQTLAGVPLKITRVSSELSINVERDISEQFQMDENNFQRLQIGLSPLNESPEKEAVQIICDEWNFNSTMIKRINLKRLSSTKLKLHKKQSFKKAIKKGFI